MLTKGYTQMNEIKARQEAIETTLLVEISPR